MFRSIICIGLIATSVVMAAAQGKNAEMEAAIAEASKAALQEIRDAKRGIGAPTLMNVPVPAELNDTDSFGKNVQFLGSGYAGTVIIDETCPPPFPLAADDICVPKPVGGGLPAALYSRPEWQITIPGKSAKNVIYLLMNHSIRHNNSANVGGAAGGQGVFTYSPVVTIESDALNSPLAIDPQSGLPMNGSFTTGLPGTRFRARIFTAGQPLDEIESYASVNGRGLSRVYWRAVGLPESVIDDLFKKTMVLKFKMNIAQFNSVVFGQYSFVVRAMGQ